MRSRVGFAARCLVVLLMVLGIVGVWAVSHTSNALAGDDAKKQAKDDAKKANNGRVDGDGNNKSKKNNNVGDGEGGADDNDEEHDTTGQVLEILPQEVPPQIIIANHDGSVTVKLMKAKLIEDSGVGVGDHVRVTGEKINELLFEATVINIRTRCCGEPKSDNDQDSDNVTDPGTEEPHLKQSDHGNRDDDEKGEPSGNR
jgi:hypothetical protein